MWQAHTVKTAPRARVKIGRVRPIIGTIPLRDPKAPSRRRVKRGKRRVLCIKVK